MSEKINRPCGDYRTTYGQDTKIFENKNSLIFTLAGILLLVTAPLIFDSYVLFLLINTSRGSFLSK